MLTDRLHEIMLGNLSIDELEYLILQRLTRKKLAESDGCSKLSRAG